MNRGMFTALSAIVIAQGLKVFTNKKLTGKWDWKPILQTGGMPSSHSAGVASLAAYTAANRGTRHTETAIAVVFGSIVMYDAQGIRRHTGEIARLVNELENNFEVISGDYPSLDYVKREKDLKELLGHQPIEVLGGALFGIAYGIIAAKIEDRKMGRA
ncbi:divergent PAP2 family protein [Jeotgalibacillus sp. S-D1]|uniref:divergent PAP2 family protein n=1 Tax=Jeotgalibacillus sp. S-D1 TaxID=2552189 RepID=UPI00105A6834|nr:divergent PAP2 family protein [Jeotgalibacillus sp. S-D1]TDL30940.1 divergent PAP2 family protein [Jeotgalibacillus sp. S-D1]